MSHSIDLKIYYLGYGKILGHIKRPFGRIWLGELGGVTSSVFPASVLVNVDILPFKHATALSCAV
jgi:hypothetical protein